MNINPPFVCNGWWSPWCFLDEWAHHLWPWTFCGHWAERLDQPQEPWLCRKHDAAVRHHYYKHHPDDAAEDGYVLTRRRWFML